MRAAGLEIRTFPHLDVEGLQMLTEGYAGPPAIVATDGVYGISGEVAPLAQLAAIADRIGAEFFVDDAHGVGVMGASGRGSLEFAGLASSRATVLGSMSKAMGAAGGFLAGRHEIVEACRRSPEASGSAIPPAAIAAAALAGLRIIRTDPGPRARMEASAVRMRAALARCDIGLADVRHPILGMLLEDEQEARALDAHFRAAGLWIPYFKYASEPRQNLLGRFEDSLTSWRRPLAGHPAARPGPGRRPEHNLSGGGSGPRRS